MGLSWADHQPDQMYDYTYPPAIEALGWLIQLSPILSIVLFSVISTVRQYRKGEDIIYFQLGRMLRPTPSFGLRQDLNIEVQQAPSNIESGTKEQSGIVNKSFE